MVRAALKAHGIVRGKRVALEIVVRGLAHLARAHLVQLGGELGVGLLIDRVGPLVKAARLR